MNPHSTYNISLAPLVSLAPRSVTKPVDPALIRATERLQLRSWREVVEDVFFGLLFVGIIAMAICFVGELVLL